MTPRVDTLKRLGESIHFMDGMVEISQPLRVRYTVSGAPSIWLNTNWSVANSVPHDNALNAVFLDGHVKRMRLGDIEPEVHLNATG